jgi:hypothetical protein
VDDEPTADDEITSVRDPAVTIVHAVPTGVRLVVPITRVDDEYVYVNAGNEEQRYSRATGYEIQPGGSWSAWRLAGKDFRRFKKKKQLS